AGCGSLPEGRAAIRAPAAPVWPRHDRRRRASRGCVPALARDPRRWQPDGATAPARHEASPAGRGLGRPAETQAVSPVVWRSWAPQWFAKNPVVLDFFPTPSPLLFGCLAPPYQRPENAENRPHGPVFVFSL